MSGKSRQAIRMSNLIEKSHQVKIEAIEDPTLINYLRLLECILDENPRKMNFYLTDLENNIEGDKRMKQIDEDRKQGKLTEAQMIKVNDDNEKYSNKIFKEITKYQQSHKNIRNIKPVKVVNSYLDTEKVYATLKEACEDNDLKYKNVRGYISKAKGKLEYKGLIIEQIKQVERGEKVVGQ